MEHMVEQSKKISCNPFYEPENVDTHELAQTMNNDDYLKLFRYGVGEKNYENGRRKKTT